jgi:hypothetical protein
MESSTLSSCKYLFSILQKNGGELKCNYAEKKCNLYSNESLFCNVKAKDWEYVDALLHTYSGEVDKYVHFLTSDNKPSFGNKAKQHKPIQNSFSGSFIDNPEPQERLHSRQIIGTTGFRVGTYEIARETSLTGNPPPV